jgi:hypothetical protein
MFNLINTFKKFVLPTALISSLAMAAFNDIKLSSIAFMDKEDLSFMADYDGLPRFLASSDDSAIKILYFPLSDKNASRIGGKWNVYRYTDHKGKVERVNKIINLKLIGNSRVILDGDFGQEFRISFMSEENTLALVKKIDKSYEILELRKFEETNKKIAKKAGSDWKSYRDSSASGAEEPIESDNDSMDLVVERVYNPSLNNEVLKGEHISGGVTKQDNENYNDLNVTANFGPGKVITFDIPVLKLKNGGQFETELAGEAVTGLVTESGAEGYRVRIASGKFSGTVINFVSEVQLAAIAEQEDERAMQMDLQGVENNEYSDQVKEQIEYTQNSAADLRAKQAKPAMNEEVEAEYFEEEAENAGEEAVEADEVVKSKIEDSGFAFGLNNRNIASELNKTASPK